MISHNEAVFLVLHFAFGAAHLHIAGAATAPSKLALLVEVHLVVLLGEVLLTLDHLVQTFLEHFVLLY